MFRLHALLDGSGDISIPAFLVCAEERSRRVPESTLVLVALIGGSAGAIAGRRYWRHKTSKQPFRTTLFSIAGIHIAIPGWFLMR